jgi:hypothetical protein
MRLASVNQGAKMENISLTERNEIVPRWAIPAIIIFFLFLALPYQFYAIFPSWLVVWLMLTLALITFIGPLLIGLLTRLPRWSMVYIGALLGVVGVYVIFTMMGLLLWPVLQLMKWFVSPDTLPLRLFYEWIFHGLMWLGVMLANGLFLALVAFAPGLRGQRPRFWRDFSLVSFSLYGGILIMYMINFDEYRYEELYVLVSMIALALGAWGYLRATTVGMRTLALLAGLTVCMAVMGIGKYFLVPLQDWDPWLPGHPPETERVFESLRTIVIWFWIALTIGLSGLVQTLRKRDLPLPPATPA